MWQKARILRSLNWPDAVGREIWTKAQPPQICTNVYSAATGKPERSDVPRVFINIKPKLPHSQAAVLAASSVELLPEFAEDVPLVTWEDFLNGADTESGEKR